MLNHVGLVVVYFQSQNLNFYAELPTGDTHPVAKVEENGAFLPSSQSPNRLGEYEQEWQIWGTTKGDALALLQDGIAALRDLNGVRRPQGVITRSQVVSAQYEPDTEWPVGAVPGPRYIAFARLHISA